MSSMIYCEGALYGPDGRELQHPNYKRQTVAVSYQDGYHGIVEWDGLHGAQVALFRLLICEKMLLEKEAWLVRVNEWEGVLVPLEIPGKGKDAPDPITIKLKPDNGGHPS
jgi:hypothetical protein